MLLTEARRAPLDQAALRRLRGAQEAVRHELGDCLSPRLTAELDRLIQPVGGDTPSAGELRVIQAELVGWLEGLTSAIQSAMVAKVRHEHDGREPR
jgi:Bacterial proteasome activator